MRAFDINRAWRIRYEPGQYVLERKVRRVWTIQGYYQEVLGVVNAFINKSGRTSADLPAALVEACHEIRRTREWFRGVGR